MIIQCNLKIFSIINELKIIFTKYTELNKKSNKFYLKIYFVPLHKMTLHVIQFLINSNDVVAAAVAGDIVDAVAEAADSLGYLGCSGSTY